MPRLRRPLPAALAALGLVLVGLLALLLVRFRGELRAEVRRTVLHRAAAALLPMVRQQVVAAQARAGTDELATAALVAAVLPSASQGGMLAVVVFDANGDLGGTVPGSLLFAELAAPDYLALLGGTPVSRLHPEFPLDRYFAGTAAGATSPVLEVLLPLDGRTPGRPLGFAQYYVEARALQAELSAIDRRVHRQTLGTLAGGTLLIGLALTAAGLLLARAQRALAERNQRLVRAHFDLTLAAKASALGQLTSHLIHGLQGPVAGLRAAVAASPADAAEWQAARVHTERMQALISEVVALLGDARGGVAFALSGGEIAASIRERNAPAADARGVELAVTSRVAGQLDSHRAGLLCLVAANLIQNAVAASAPGRRVEAVLEADGARVRLTVADQGAGIPPVLVERLFEAGASGRAGGSGLGLALSRLILRQVEGELELAATGPAGTVFRATMPRGDRG